MTNNNQEILDLLLKIKTKVNNDFLFPVLDPEAKALVPSNPFAFCVASCLDRGTKAEIIWTIPYWISQIVGHFDPEKFYQMSLPEVTEIFSKLPKKPRYINMAPATFQSITSIILDQFGGNSRKIWEGKKAKEVKKTFLSVKGVGEGISNMTVILIENAFEITFSDLDHTQMNIKPDVHTMRVLYRLGVAAYIEEIEAISAGRILNPEYPGEIDGPLWYVGRTWCKAEKPRCNDCDLESECERIGL